MKKSVTWIVVADHQNVRVFRNDGPGHGLEPVAGWESHKPLKTGRGIMADRPGRSFDSRGAGRHAMVPHTDPRTTEALHFLGDLVERLAKAAEAGTFARIVLIAPPRALGEIRQLLPENLKSMVVGELAEDLTKHATASVLEHVQKVIAA